MSSSSSSSSTTSSASNPNIFTPPSSCLNGIFTLAPLGHAIGNIEEAGGGAMDAPGQYIDITNDAQGIETACYPPGVFRTYLETESNGDVSTSTESAVISPATCPFGYTNLAQSVITGTTTATCCPVGAAIGNAGAGTSSATNWLCVIAGGHYTYVNASGGETSSVTLNPAENVYHMRQIVVAWQAADLSSFTMPASTSSSSSSSSPSNSSPLTSTPTATQPLPTATTTPPQPALSTGAKAGIAIGAILGALVVLLLIVGIIWRRRRRNRTGPPPTTDPVEKPELPGEGIEHPQLASRTIYELPPQDKPSEVESRAAPVEMEGEWAGWEAPALVEVDMSRPAAASRNGGSGHHDRLQQLAKQSRARE